MDVVRPTVGILSQCAADQAYQLAIQTEVMIKDVVRHLTAEVATTLQRLTNCEPFVL